MNLIISLVLLFLSILLLFFRNLLSRLTQQHQKVNMDDNLSTVASMLIQKNPNRPLCAFWDALCRNDFSQTPTEIALSTYCGLERRTCSEDNLFHLETIGLPIEYGSTALALAVWQQRADVIGDLVAAGADVCSRDTAGKTALYVAAEQSIDGLVEKLSAAVNIADHHGNTPLHIATVVSSHSYNVEDLLRVGANVNAINNNGQTPLRVADIYSNDWAIDLMLACGACESHLLKLNRKKT